MVDNENLKERRKDYPAIFTELRFMSEKIDDVKTRTKSIEYILNGNGEPEHGLVFRAKKSEERLEAIFILLWKLLVSFVTACGVAFFSWLTLHFHFFTDFFMKLFET